MIGTVNRYYVLTLINDLLLFRNVDAKYEAFRFMKFFVHYLNIIDFAEKLDVY